MPPKTIGDVMRQKGWTEKAIAERGLDHESLKSVRRELRTNFDLLEVVVGEDTALGDVELLLLDHSPSRKK